MKRMLTALLFVGFSANTFAQPFTFVEITGKKKTTKTPDHSGPIYYIDLSSDIQVTLDVSQTTAAVGNKVPKPGNNQISFQYF